MALNALPLGKASTTVLLANSLYMKYITMRVLMLIAKFISHMINHEPADASRMMMSTVKSISMIMSIKYV